MKLWVDDLRDAPDESWTVVRKVQSVINALSLFECDEISLDHDIENRPDDETFFPVAQYIGLMYENTHFKPKITIHSINPVGAQNMHDLLFKRGIDSAIIPYAPDMERLRREYGIE